MDTVLVSTITARRISENNRAYKYTYIKDRNDCEKLSTLTRSSALLENQKYSRTKLVTSVEKISCCRSNG